MWHVQQMGQGPVLLLLHGTGASTHSWRDLAPRLAAQFTVIAPDLPGHGFSAMPAPAQLSLTGMARAVADLVDVLGLTIAGAVGHSAGAAIAVQMVFGRRIAPQVVMGMNAALLPLDGAARVLFPPTARLMAATSLAPRLFAWRASDRSAVTRLIDGTGSTLDERGLALYGRLVGDVKHVSAALGMMARWNLEDLEARLRDLDVPLSLLVGTRDRAVPPAHARRVLAALPLTTPATLTVLEGLSLIHI